MRIQHNIMAMNAYRNYNNNTSAVSRNLEKLSSGYKINRAGDDAAGLAISEKMRAQITGLNAAQKNVKDGISLVKTAEGAMQEIQDMLNRMDYLATQSANGTYDNEVDRANLQKEVDNLKTEINRIADSANFNGIKLLDGSLDETIKATDQVTETVTVNPTESEALTFENGKLADVGQVLGTNTVLHNEANGNAGTSFSVDFHNFKFNAANGNSLTMKMGDTEIKLTSKADNGTLEGDKLVSALLGAKNYEISVNGKAVDTLDGMLINGQAMKVEQGSLDYRLTFTQQKAPASEADEINGAMEVKISGEVKPKNAEYSFQTSDLAATPAAGDVLTINGKQYVVQDDDIDTTGADAAAKAANTWNNIISNINKEGVEGYKVSIDAGKVTMKANDAGEKTTPTVSYKAIQAATGTALNAVNTTEGKDAVAATGTFALGALTNGDKFKINGTEITYTGAVNTDTAVGTDGKYTYQVAADGTLTIKAATAGADGNGTVEVTKGDGTKSNATLAGGKDAIKDVWTYTVTDWNDANLGPATIAINSKACEVDFTQVSAAGERGISLVNAAGDDTGYVVSLDGDKLILTAKDGGAAGSDGPGNAPAANGSIAFNTYADPTKLTADKITVEQEGASGGAMKGITEGANGDFNVSTTAISNVEAGGGDRLASTFFDLTEDMVQNGAQIKIGDDVFTFTTDEKLVGTGNYVDARGDLTATAKNLTEKAKGNAVWTVGHDGARITLTETVDHGKLKDNNNLQDYKNKCTYDLSTKEGIEQSLGFVGAGSYTKENVVSEATKGGKPLTLQIGDTSDDYNQMKVSVGDMHVSAMKLTDEKTGETTSIADIDIGSQDGAAKAVDVIKNAINYVSSVRGDLGAIQNRLEHTANNLSVMAENIQDAESTIRDTDIAEEMMSYTKNNILVQSAQAMLAQANQVPQGVLQLLG